MERTCLLEKSEEQKMTEGMAVFIRSFFLSALDGEKMVWTCLPAGC